MSTPSGPGPGAARFGAGAADPWAAAREAMVRDQIAARGVRDPRVLAALRQVPRHRFVPAHLSALAYADRPLPIGQGQTISQPYIVAAMAEALALDGSERVLEVGAGSGYMAAVLALLAREVYALEREPVLVEGAALALAGTGCARVHLACADGALGWPERAPFAAILLSCAAPAIPEPLWRQLSMDGRIILPLGAPGAAQELVLAERSAATGRRLRRLMAVSFVPLRTDALPGSP